MSESAVEIKVGDSLTVLRGMPDKSVHCVVTSPPYYGLRDYGTGEWVGGDDACAHMPSGEWLSSQHGTHGSMEGGVATQKAAASIKWHRGDFSVCPICGARRIDQQIGLETSVAEHMRVLVELFREVRRVLRDDGTMWVNYGDAYASTPNGRSAKDTKSAGNDDRTFRDKPISTVGGSLKPKDRMLLPARLAIALQDDGWWVRDEIIWSKPNPMPSSVKDRTTPSHELIYMFSKKRRYYYDQKAIREARVSEDKTAGPGSHANVDRGPVNKKIKVPGGWDLGAGAHGTINRDGRTSAKYKTLDVAANTNTATARRVEGFNDRWDETGDTLSDGKRNKRSVWTVAPRAFKEAHFATFPPDLIEPCILASCPAGGTVLDPFGGAGTTGLVAQRHGRNAILIELNPEYAAMARKRIDNDALPKPKKARKPRAPKPANDNTGHASLFSEAS